ncbi:MAG: glycosyltransferase family 2 protein [Candidatus Omnitrophica bacterium]|nr:glycosyltransferase family 2 protein [Candidatus Omnitrophota bacterium]
MEKEILEITAIIPALNEEDNIALAVKNALGAFEESGINGEVIVINDGSRDKTGERVISLMREDKRIRLISHDKPQGVGASFWGGVDNARGGVVVFFPGDNEVDPWEILRYFKLLEHVDIVIPFVFNKQVRSLFRNALSFVYRFIINTTFLVNFNYTNGTILYRKSILKELEFRSKGFFFQTDILVRAVKKGYLFAEVPYRLGIRKEGISKAVSFPSLVKVMWGYLYLVKDFYFRRGMRENNIFGADTKTAARKQKYKP